MPRNQGGSYVADETGKTRLVERTAPAPPPAPPPATDAPPAKPTDDKPAPIPARRKE